MHEPAWLMPWWLKAMLGMALLAGAFFLKQQIDDSWKTAKMAVTQYQLLNTD